MVRSPASQAVVHPHATLAYFTSGDAVIWCGARFAVSKGDVLAIPEGQAHYVLAAKEAQAWVLSFCASCMSSNAGHALVSVCQSPVDGLGKVRSLPDRDQASLEAQFHGLEAELLTQDPFRDLAVDGYLSLIASHILRAAATQVEADQRTGSLCAEALAFIQARALEGISLEDVADAVHRSVAHTAAVVKKETGMTVVAWITHSRMAAARELLLKTDESVESVAARLGFSSPAHFHRVFKRVHGTTPASWRRAHSHRDGSLPTGDTLPVADVSKEACG